ncbi:chorismate-binding protein [candidate division KSB1 bacterium]|nr:chorismate-binding protein [candidate division KSB1 bacterium]
MTQEQSARIRAWVEMPASWGDPPRRFVFGEPLERWQADTLEQVRPALDRVAAAQRSGHYIVGYVSYEAGPAFDPALRTPPPGALPYAWFAAFNGPIGTPAAPEMVPPSKGQLTGTGLGPAPSVSGTRFSTTENDYLRSVEHALAHIRAGDIYQVNYTVRAEFDLNGDPFALFLDRLAAVPMPHAAYLDGGEWAIVSLSPELFLRRRGQILESRPMKGTAARRPSWRDDEAARRGLAASDKERAENTMIVDLVRNDLGRVCRAGSVQVPEWCVVSRFPTVHQMTSLVRGELGAGVSLSEIFAAVFPPGSVTGAPKVRAMEIIRDLEPEPRGVYCGTVGLFFPGGDFELNVAIRTLEIQNPKPKTQNPSRVPPSVPPLKRRGAEPDSGWDAKAGDAVGPYNLARRTTLGLGSGIVADSDPAAEWQETLLKGRFLNTAPFPEFALIETLAWVPGEGFRNLHLHLRRLRRSAAYFGWELDLRNVIVELRSVTPPSPPVKGGESADTPLLSPLGRGDGMRVRVELTPTEISVQTSPLEPWSAQEVRLFIYDREPVDPQDVFLYHKTTERGIYERAQAAAQAAGADEALLLNASGEATEGTRTNLFVKLDGKWLTPALECGLLPGIYRERWVAEGRGREAIITVSDLDRAEKIIVANSARGAVRAEIRR